MMARLRPCSPALPLAGLQQEYEVCLLSSPPQVHLSLTCLGRPCCSVLASRSLWQTFPVCSYSPYFPLLSLSCIITGIQPVIRYFLVGWCGICSLGCRMRQKSRSSNYPHPPTPTAYFSPLELGAPTTDLA